MFKRVLLCYDGSLAGRRALRRGAELAIGFWWSSSERGTLAERARCCILVAVDPEP